MNTSFLVIGGILLLCAAFIYLFPSLIAGYNMMSKTEQVKYNIRKIKTIISVDLLIFALLALVFSFLTETRWVHLGWTILFLGSILAVIIYCNSKHCCNK
ncbi:DUF3784 domain-containing protein [Bacteroides heparinolyticus]|uniref:DUF3784 domain-containing protein n=1 Tax=Prevotella heparinolytica TaxID=28113 RepID=UPI00359F785B